MAMNAGELISAPIRDCHARLGVEGKPGHQQFTITDVRTHNGQMSVSGPNGDGTVTEVTFPISSPLSEPDGMWEIATGSGPLVIPHHRG